MGKPTQITCISCFRQQQRPRHPTRPFTSSIPYSSFSQQGFFTCCFCFLHVRLFHNPLSALYVMAFAICNEKIRLLSIRYAIYEAIRLAFFNSRCCFSIPFFGCQSFSVSQGYWFPKLWASQSCFGFPKGFWVCAKGLFPICFPVQYIRFPGGNSAVMLVGRKQTPVSEALVWDHFISDFSLAFTAFFRN